MHQPNNYTQAVTCALGLAAALATSAPAWAQAHYPITAAQRALPWLDWVGLDIKTAFDDYHTVTGVPRSGEPVRRSLDILLTSGIEFECRTTLHPAWHDETALAALAAELAALGVKHYHWQTARLPKPWPAAPADWPGSLLLQQAERLFEAFSLRAA